MRRVLCSVGAVIGRPNGRNIRLLSACQGQLECDGFEFMMYDSWYEKLEEIEEFMVGFSAPVPVFHCEKGIGDRVSRNAEGDMEEALRRFEINCALARKMRAYTLVLHLWSGLDSDRDIEHNIRAYAHLREIAERHGLLLTVENVVCNRRDPITHMKRLIEVYPDVRFTFDTKMAEFHAQIPDMLLEENRGLWDHIAHMHVNDYLGGYMEWEKLRTLHIGDGQVRFGPLFEYLRAYGYAGDFTIEATSFGADGIIRFDDLNRSFRRLRGLISGR